MERKQKILDKLLELIHMNPNGEEVEELKYSDAGKVHVIFRTGYIYDVNVKGDSELMMCLDVLKYIVR